MGKVCKKCGLEKPFENYSLDGSARDGLQKWCKDCWHNFHPQNRKNLTPEEAIKSIVNKAKYGWNKWGGDNEGLVQEDITEEWYCQACNEKQTSELPPFMYEYSKREYIRVCSICQNKIITQHIKPLRFALLILIVRKKHGVEYVDNLAE